MLIQATTRLESRKRGSACCDPQVAIRREAPLGELGETTINQSRLTQSGSDYARAARRSPRTILVKQWKAKMKRSTMRTIRVFWSLNEKAFVTFYKKSSGLKDLTEVTLVGEFEFDPRRPQTNTWAHYRSERPRRRRRTTERTPLRGARPTEKIHRGRSVEDHRAPMINELQHESDRSGLRQAIDMTGSQDPTRVQKPKSPL